LNFVQTVCLKNVHLYHSGSYARTTIYVGLIYVIKHVMSHFCLAKSENDRTINPLQFK